MRGKFVAAGCLGLSLAAAAVPSAALADAAAGEKLARQWCASCHVLPGTPPADVPQGPPTFAAVAHMGKTPGALRAFLSKPHGSMPDLSLSRAEIEDLIAYIETLH